MSETRGENFKEPQNEKPEIESIDEATSFEELFEYLKKTGGLRGSREFYDAKELIQIIDQVRLGGMDTNRITRTQGLREKVKSLMK